MDRGVSTLGELRDVDCSVSPSSLPHPVASDSSAPRRVPGKLLPTRDAEFMAGTSIFIKQMSIRLAAYVLPMGRRDEGEQWRVSDAGGLAPTLCAWVGVDRSAELERGTSSLFLADQLQICRSIQERKEFFWSTPGFHALPQELLRMVSSPITSAIKRELRQSWDK